MAWVVLFVAGLLEVGCAVLGIVLFREPATAMRLTCIGLIVAGIIGLKLASSSPSAVNG
jgi:quaternary ammonium compound-resistance protein SugE